MTRCVELALLFVVSQHHFPELRNSVNSNRKVSTKNKKHTPKFLTGMLNSYFFSASSEYSIQSSMAKS